jgi:hypothetical protein
MRSIASHAAMSGVGKHTARESEAPNVVRMGKSAWRAPTPDFGPGTSVPGPLSFMPRGALPLREFSCSRNDSATKGNALTVSLSVAFDT